MAIPEHQLQTWTGLGSIQQSSATYQSIKQTLENISAPYAAKNVDAFLQGSYGNDTNIYGDSDVDIVLRTKSFFHYNLDGLPEPQKLEFKRIHPNKSEYDLTKFKSDVIPWLDQHYGNDLDFSSNKALRLKPTNNRRSADILLAAPHKRFMRYCSEQDQQAVEGIIFVASNGTHIINYPKQHSTNLTLKHQATGNRLKPMVRIYKNMRNRMVERGLISTGRAPSYFIEGMLSNIPNENFGGTLQASVEACWVWINNCDQGSLMCANGIHPLSCDNTNTSWPIQGFIDYLNGVRDLWQSW